MSLYVTSILMGSAYNTGIPLAFAFGNSEDKAMYLDLLQTFEQQVGVSLHNKVIESDQGSALKAAIAEFKMLHLACLRHLLVSLKYNFALYHIGLLLRAVSDVDFEGAKHTHCPPYSALRFGG